MKRKTGYTIIEVLIAVILLAIILPGLSIAVIAARKTQTNNQRFENAAAFAQRVYDSLSLLPPPAFSSENVTTGSTQDTLDKQVYTANWTRTPIKNGSTILGGAKLQVDISWNTGGTPHRSTLTGALK